MRRRRLTRRAFLRGTVAGTTVTLALPPLEALLGPDPARADGHGDESFFGLFFWANGLPWNDKHGAEQAGRPDLWTPATTGPGFDAPELLAPIAGYPISVVTGLEPKTEIPSEPPGQGDGHMRGFMVTMTGDRPRSAGFDHSSHTLTSLRPSLDQVVARHPRFYERRPRFRSLHAGVSRARFHDYGHWNGVSYNGPESLNLPVSRPGDLFDMLFGVPGDGEELGRRSRVLDAVLEDADGLRRQLGREDERRLDAHLEHVDSLRRRLDATRASCEEPARPSDAGNLLERTSTMAELLALAVKCGLTRVFTFMVTSPATTHVFSNLGVPDGMHKTCHDGHWERVRAITAHQMQAFARVLDAFSEELPGGGTLLDRGCIYGTSEYGEGWKHSVRELPVVIAGRAGGALRPGVHVRKPRGNLAEAQLTTLQALGLPVDQFGFHGAETSSALGDVLT